MNSPAPAPVIPPAAVSPSGIITLANYWVGPPVARPGRTVSIVYVVDNGTGTTVHLVLGASIKPTSAPSWIANAVSDPARDAVAVVAPGTTIHLRYFRLPINLQPGTYDVAWGLRNPLTHQRVILLTARAYLHVIRSA